MIEVVSGLPDNVVGLNAIGTVSADDYESVVIPAIEAASKDGQKARFLFVLGPGFDGYAAEAALDDAKMGMHHWSDFERVALVTDHGMYRSLVKAFGFLMPGKVKVFDVASLEEAKTWVADS